MSKYTPGPWIVSADLVRIITPEDALDFEIASCSGADSGHPCPSEIEMAANACLIAAAPDLLAALKSIMARIEDGTLVRSIENDASPAWALSSLRLVAGLSAAQNAIVKAEGRA